MKLAPCRVTDAEKSSSITPPYLVKDKGEIYRLFRDVVVLPGNIALPIIELFYKWLEGSGPEWTIERLKNLKTLYLQHVAGNRDFRLGNNCRIRCHRDGTPYGPFRGLWKLQGHKNVSKVLTILQSYTNVKLINPTEKQLDKFYKGVFCPHLTVSSHLSLPNEIKQLYNNQEWDKAKYDKVDRWTSGVKQVITPDTSRGKSLFKTVPEVSLSNDRHIADYLMFCAPLIVDERFKRLHEVALKEDPVLLIRESPALLTSLYSLYPEPCRNHFPFHIIHKTYDPTGKDDNIVTDLPIVGKIGFIQERGGKLRAVANPLRVIQVVLSRIHNYFMSVAKSLPFDCTYDQFEGVRWAQRKLKEGYKLYSFDLSDASSTMPLSDQLNIFKKIGPQSEEFQVTLEYFERIARGLWFDTVRGTHMKDGYPFTRWFNGQPLGSLFSFPSMAQGHGLRCASLAYKDGLDPYDTFRVLGDDVIIVEQLAHQYESFVTNVWHCDISAHKTLISDKVGEFASKIITSDRLIANPKFSNHPILFDPCDPLDVLRRYGKKGIKLVPSSLKMPVKLLSCLRKPMGMSYRYKSEEQQSLDLREVANSIPTDLPKPLLNCAIVQVEDSSISKFRAPGRHGMVIYPRSRANREQDLNAAFLPTTQHCYIKYFAKSYVSNVKDRVRLDPGSFMANRRERFKRLHQKKWHYSHDYDDQEIVEYQWMILHLNANMENESAFIREFREHIREESLPVTSPKDAVDERGGRISKKKIRQLFRWAFSAIASFLGGYGSKRI